MGELESPANLSTVNYDIKICWFIAPYKKVQAIRNNERTKKT